MPASTKSAVRVLAAASVLLGSSGVAAAVARTPAPRVPSTVDAASVANTATVPEVSTSVRTDVRPPRAPSPPTTAASPDASAGASVQVDPRPSASQQAPRTSVSTTATVPSVTSPDEALAAAQTCQDAFVGAAGLSGFDLPDVSSAATNPQGYVDALFAALDQGAAQGLPTAPDTDALRQAASTCQQALRSLVGFGLPGFNGLLDSLTELDGPDPASDGGQGLPGLSGLPGVSDAPGQQAVEAAEACQQALLSAVGLAGLDLPDATDAATDPQGYVDALLGSFDGGFADGQVPTFDQDALMAALNTCQGSFDAVLPAGLGGMDGLFQTVIDLIDNLPLLGGSGNGSGLPGLGSLLGGSGNGNGSGLPGLGSLLGGSGNGNGSGLPGLGSLLGG